MVYMKVGSGWYKIDLREPVVEGAKDIGSRRKTPTDKNIVAAYAHGLSPGVNKRDYDTAKAAWRRYQAKTGDEFRSLVTRLRTGQLTKNQFLHRSRSLFKGAYEKAYRLGTDAGGMKMFKLPKEDLRWLARARSAEYKFLDGFANDVVAGRGVMDYDRRADMYVQSMDGMFDAGRVDAHPDDGTEIVWQLSPLENCPDCIDLAMDSPYTPETLPTTPGAGGTQCLSNCGCSLYIRYTRPPSVDIDIEPVAADTIRKLALPAVAGAVALAARARDKKTTDKDIGVIDFEAEVEGDYEYYEARAIDWNKLDDMMSASATLKLLEQIEPSRWYLTESRTALNIYEEAARGLPEWLDPFSRDVYVWHRIGAAVLVRIRKGDLEGGDGVNDEDK